MKQTNFYDALKLVQRQFVQCNFPVACNKNSRIWNKLLMFHWHGFAIKMSICQSILVFWLYFYMSWWNFCETFHDFFINMLQCLNFSTSLFFYNAYVYRWLFKQKLEHKWLDGFNKWGLKHINEKNKIEIYSWSYISWKYLTVFVCKFSSIWILSEFCWF